MNTPQQFGFVRPEIDLNAYILGGQTKLPKIVLQPTGQWDEFAPKYEAQFNEFFDSYGCTIWGSQNGYEFLFKRIEGVEYNFSERFNYILSRIRPPGADPHKVLMDMHNYGVIPDERLPMTRFVSDFMAPDPMTEPYLKEGREFPYILRHEWVIYGTTTGWKEKMMEALQYSPLCAGVYAWAEENGIYKRMGSDTHWTVIFGYKEGEYWKCFDSYDQSVKHLDWEFGFTWVKRLYAEKKEDNIKMRIGIIQQIVELLRKVLSLRILLDSYGWRKLAAWMEYEKTLGAARSPQWPRVRREYLKRFPTCALCGGAKTLEIHHKKMFSKNPELELDLNNLITLCESGKNGIVCHRAFGHLGNYQRENPSVEEDVKEWHLKLTQGCPE